MGTNGSNSADSSAVRAGIAISVCVSFAIALVWLCCHFSRSVKQEDDRRRLAGSVPTVGSAPSVRQQPPPPAVPPVELPAGAPLVCTYRRADGWREATCPVCLSDMADGETVRVLPACMHYFHAACVGEWLRSNTTCPVCRAAAAAAAEVLDAVV